MSATGDAEAVIVGGGPAGAAAAIALVRAGRRALLLERDAAPREAVCGEFLGPDAADALARLGLDAAALGAVPLRRLRMGHGRREAATELPFPGWGLSRRVLDAALREAARTAGAGVVEGAAVRGAEVRGGAWRIQVRPSQHPHPDPPPPAGEGEEPSPAGGRSLAAAPPRGGGGGASGGDTLTTPRLLLATGKHPLRGHPRAPAPTPSLGLKLHLRGVAPAPEVVLLSFAGGYAGLLPTEGGGANLCAVLHRPGAADAAAARDPAALLARVAAGSDLAARLLRDARPAWPRPLAIGAVPYGFRNRDAAGPPGLFRLGDQLSVIPSFAGDGVVMALLSGLAAAEAVAVGRDAAAFHTAWRRRSAGPMRWAGLGALAARWWPWGVVAASAAAPGAARAVARWTRMDPKAGRVAA